MSKRKQNKKIAKAVVELKLTPKSIRIERDERQHYIEMEGRFYRINRTPFFSITEDYDSVLPSARENAVKKAYEEIRNYHGRYGKHPSLVRVSISVDTLVEG
jgi:hypothetical protein